MKKRALEVLDYENEKEYSRQNEVYSDTFGLHQRLPDDFLNKLENEEIHFKNKVNPTNHLWEVHLMKTQAQFFRYLSQKVNQDSMFPKKITEKVIQVKSVKISQNQHFVYVFWDFAQSHTPSRVTQREKNLVNLELNKGKDYLAREMMKDLGLRKPPNIAFFASRVRDQVKTISKLILEKKVEEFEEEFKEKNPVQYRQLVNSHRFEEFIAAQVPQIQKKLESELSQTIIDNPNPRKKEKRLKKALEAHGKKGKKPKSQSNNIGQ